MANLEASQERDISVVEQTATKRAEYTRRFFNKKGPEALDEFAANLKNEPFKIDIKTEDDKSLALGIAELQKKLGLPSEDHYNGCDGKFGEITELAYNNYLKHETVKQETHEALQSVDPLQNSDVKTQEVSQTTPQKGPKEQKETTPKYVKDTILIGDSITSTYSHYMEGAKKGFEGGRSTTWMLKNFLATFVEKDQNGHYQLKPEYKGTKNIVLLGGVNDITNGASVPSIMKNLNQIVEVGNGVGLNITICTVPSWDTNRLSDFYKKQWAKAYKKKGKGWNNGVYPYSGEDLATKTVQLNKEIRKLGGRGFKVVDLYQEMTDTQKYPRVDGLHPSPKGAKALAKYIRQETNTVG